MKWLAHFFIFLPTLLLAAPQPHGQEVERAKELKEYIRKERPQFEKREAQKRNVIEELDRLNASQNHVRSRVSEIITNRQELTVASDNLSLEHEKQKRQEDFEKHRLVLLLKVIYKIKKDGMLRFVIRGDNLSTLGGRVRVLYRTLRSHSRLTQQLQERAQKLQESEKKLQLAKEQLGQLLEELQDQELLLNEILAKKHVLLHSLDQKQQLFHSALREYKQVSKQLSALFNQFEATRTDGQTILPGRGTLPLPLEAGRLLKTFGKLVHKQFKTVTYQKGLELEAEMNAPVRAVMPGIVEFEGWLKGLGNVVILHHGGGFYSLSAHLFKTLQLKGSSVQQGEQIGLVGDTGSSEKPSLYFELRENGKAVDPLAYFSQSALKNLQ
ncbi:MAG: peptidoglycan DD-metalloendopeptidase family protein [Deltaproteobacteria bacterium]|nr:peptidoglycan DD-metalloendopeptidase family protein [Deltaproteobacteria bacterium]